MENVYYVHKRNTLNVLFGQIANKPSIRHRTYVGDLTTISFLKEEENEKEINQCTYVCNNANLKK